MKKLMLRLEDLQIDSFHTTTERKEKGTVFGEQCTCQTACSCPGCPTCVSCGVSCFGTCGDTCSCNLSCDAATCGGSCDGGCATEELFSCLPDCTVSNLPTRCDGLDCS